MIAFKDKIKIGTLYQVGSEFGVVIKVYITKHEIRIDGFYVDPNSGVIDIVSRMPMYSSTDVIHVYPI